MCTSIAMKTRDFYFGRTMDIEYSFNECVVFTPRNYPVNFRKAGNMCRHYALLGMGTVIEDFPLYAEAVNEKGLCIAGLNFPDSAYYPPKEDEKRYNISPFELIFWLLGKCASVSEARKLLEDTHFINIPFNEKTPLTPLHWHIADSESSIVLESTKRGMEIYDDPAGVLTNNPSFDFQMTNLCQYMNLTTGCPKNCFSDMAAPFGQGLGSFGLPGDFSPSSRFVKAVYLNLNSVCEEDEQGSISQFFHLLNAVTVVRGSVLTQDDACDITSYSCCINASKKIYYYTTYSNSQITAVDMRRENLNGRTPKKYPLIDTQQIAWMN